ncbi:MAG: heavy metal translocating P-type ATPase [Anaerolineaceae bacterium]|nr:heavy metal translocating P-type ATPase [Anaerolineaceae bacterium]
MSESCCGPDPVANCCEVTPVRGCCDTAGPADCCGTLTGQAAVADCCDHGRAEPGNGQRSGIPGFVDYLLARRETRLTLVGGGGVLLTLLASLTLALPILLVFSAYTLALLIALWPVTRSGLDAMRRRRAFNINLLMTIAALGAIALGEHLEAAAVVILFSLGEALEGYNMGRTRASLRSLMQLAPELALRLHDGQESQVPVADLQLDDRVLVRAGDRIPVDGVVLDGYSDINQASLTGESLPRPVGPADEVYAGTVNGSGGLELKVTRLAQDSAISRIIRLVAEAQETRAQSWRLIDRFARVYTPLAALLALLVATVPPLFFGQPFLNEGGSVGWIYRGLALLVIACPCALVISTPVTVISAINAAARRGVLIKGGVYLELLGRIRTIAFDKTGTLTTNRPGITDLYSLDCTDRDIVCSECEDVLALAAAVERGSSHPLAQAISAESTALNLADRYAMATQVTALAGRGVQGYVDDQLVTLGSHVLFENEHPHPRSLCDMIAETEERGETAVLLCDGERVRGYISLADQPRENAREAIGELHDLGLRTVMLTGDNQQAADVIGAMVGVRDIRAGLLPEDKLDAIRDLEASGQPVAMVGDGINDTPALSAASLGIAPGGIGSDQALESADVVLMADDLSQLPFAIRLGRRALATIRNNIALSLSMKAAFLILAVTGGVSLWAAIVADVGLTLVVTLNSMRLLRAR